MAGSVSISDVTITEGQSGTQLANFTVTRTGGTAAFNINYATAANGSASSAGGDYVAMSGTLQFGAGVNSQTVSVTINGDIKFEPAETFFVNLSGATNGATISDGQAVGTISNDDANHAPVVTAPDRTMSTGQSIAAASLFTVSDLDDQAMTRYAFWDGTRPATPANSSPMAVRCLPASGTTSRRRNFHKRFSSPVAHRMPFTSARSMVFCGPSTISSLFSECGCGFQRRVEIF